MQYLIVPLATTAKPKGAITVTGLEFIKFVNDMSAAHEIVIGIPAAWAAWKTLLLTRRWKTQNEARADEQFQNEFLEMIQK